MMRRIVSMVTSPFSVGCAQARTRTGGYPFARRRSPTIRPGRLTKRSALGVVLRGLRLELEPDEALVADDPRVVTGLDDVRVAGADLELGAVVVLDAELAGLDDADVVHLAAVGAGDGLDAFRPPPPRLEGEPSGGRRAHPHHVHLR